MRTRMLIVALCSVAVAEVCLAGENPGTKSGWQYLKEGDYARAERVFEQVLNSDPHDLKAWEGYRIAFQKRKAQEEGRPDDETPAIPQDASAPEDRPKPKAKRSAKPERSSDEESRSESSSGSRGDDSSSDSEKAHEEREEIGKVDPAALKNAKRAKERFEKLREELTQTYRRSHSGVTELHVTFYNNELYRLLCERLGAEKGWSYDKAQKLYEATVKDMRGQLEFYVKLVNYSSKPKKSVPIGDIVKKTTFVDEEGNAYEPARWKAPKNAQLVGDDAYTVWFSRTDSDGADILKKAVKGNVYLVVTDLAFETNQIQVAYPLKKLTTQGAGKPASQKGWMDRIKGLWQ